MGSEFLNPGSELSFGGLFALAGNCFLAGGVAYTSLEGFVAPPGEGAAVSPDCSPTLSQPPPRGGAAGPACQPLFIGSSREVSTQSENF